MAAGLEPVQIRSRERGFRAFRLSGQTEPIMPAPTDHDTAGGSGSRTGLLGAAGKIVDQRIECWRIAEAYQFGRHDLGIERPRTYGQLRQQCRA